MKVGKGHAHAKIILIGEHAVVYGYPALALPLRSSQVHVTLKNHDVNYIESALYKGPIETLDERFNPIKKLVEKLIQDFNMSKIYITIQTDIPINAGLGSSAAIASALVEAFFNYHDVALSHDVRFNYVQYSETLAHQNPSGIDAMITMTHTPIKFKKGEPFEPFELDLNGFLVVGNTGVKGKTKEAVMHIASTMQKAKTQALIDQLGVLTQRAINAISTHDLDALGNTLTLAHETLTALEVSHPLLDELVKDSLSKGALGAKMTGGGLGGCAIALVRDELTASAIKESWILISGQDAFILPLKKEG